MELHWEFEEVHLVEPTEKVNNLPVIKSASNHVR